MRSLALLLASLLGSTALAGEASRGKASAPSAVEAAPPQREAERIAKLKGSIDDDRKALAELKALLEDPESEDKKAEASFQESKTRIEETERQVQSLKDAGKESEVAPLEEKLAELEKKRDLAEQRLLLAIENQKALREQVKVLEDRIRAAAEQVRKLEAHPAEAVPAGPENGPPLDGHAQPPAPDDKTAQAASPATESVPAPGAPAAILQGAVPGIPPESAAPISPGGVVPTAPQAEKPVSEDLLKARKEAEERQAAVEEAKKDVLTAQQRIDSLTKDIRLTRERRDNARMAMDLAEKELMGLNATLGEKINAGAPREDLSSIQKALGEARERYGKAQRDVRALNTRLDDLQTAFSEARGQEILLLQAKAETERKASAAERKRILYEVGDWLLSHVPRIVLVFIGMWIANRLVRILSGRLVKLISRASLRGAQDERENRAHTLIGVFQNTATVLIIGGGIVAILQEIGAPVGPILGGAAIAGLAVAFGAQRLVQDFFHGFVILLENQYVVNDVVRVAGISGLVERITMRMTVLRDLEGCVHFIPNGQITTVTNMTHGWSRALFDVCVAYKEDVDRVMEVLLDIGKGLRQDPQFSSSVLEDPTMLGVDAMADSAIVIKFYMKTRPLQQWTVKREMLRRIKRRFDELGIELPFPHRTVYLRKEEGENVDETSLESPENLTSELKPRGGRRGKSS